MTHSFYVVMGGFALYDKKGNLYRPVHPEDFPVQVEAKFAFPTISEEEIQDRSKGDGLTKTIAVFQLLWFSIQLIGRLAKGWAATELEVLTFATCILTVITYIFWWNKPLDVHCQIVLEPIQTGAEDVQVDDNDPVAPEEDREYRASQHILNHRALTTVFDIQHQLSDSSNSSSSSHRIQPHAINFTAGCSDTTLTGKHFSSS